ncbi:MAG: hypothetical protein U0841_15305 [Chloroflexia bacterium]
MAVGATLGIGAAVALGLSRSGEERGVAVAAGTAVGVATAGAIVAVGAGVGVALPPGREQEARVIVRRRVRAWGVRACGGSGTSPPPPRAAPPLHFVCRAK